MVNLEWYRTFKAIYQNGTLTRAAEELMISQPNVSIQLASLETYIGHSLFIRLPRRMEPTEYGKRLYTQIVESIDNLERVESEFKKSNLKKTPTIRLGAPPEILLSYLARDIGKLKSNINVTLGMADELIAMLVNNELDVAVITKPNLSNLAITYEPLFTETFMIVCSPDFDASEFNKLLESRDLRIIEKWLKKQVWYAYSNTLVLIRRFWRENFKKRPILSLQAVIPNNNALLDAVSRSNALIITSDVIGGKELINGSVKILWKGFTPATNNIFLGYDKSKTEPAIIDEIRSFIYNSTCDILKPADL